MSQFVQWIESDYTSCKPPVLPSLAEEHFIEWLDNQFRLLNTDEPWTLWRDLVKKQLDRRTVENEEVIDEVFDKSEANAFGEVMLVCRKLMGKLHLSLTESGLSAEDVKKTLQSIESDCPGVTAEVIYEFE